MVHLLKSLSLRLACCSFLSSKCFTIKVNTICGRAQLLVSGCLKSMCHKFNSQGPGLRILELMIAGPKSAGFSSRVPGFRSQGLGPQVPGSQGFQVSDLRSQGLGPQVSGSRLSGSRVSGSQVSGPRVLGLRVPHVMVPSLRVPGLGFQVLILDNALFINSKFL